MMMQKKRFVAFGMAACMLLLSACGKDKAGDSSAEEEGKSTAVEVQTVADGEMAATNTLAGQVTAIQDVQVFPLLAGQVQTLNVKEGDMVTKGQTLFTIDTSTVTSTLGALQQSYAATRSATDQAIASAQLGVKNAQIAVDQAQTLVNDTHALFEVGAASSQQVTQAEQGLEQAQAGLEQAQSGVQQAQASQSASLAQIQASIDQIQAQAAMGTVTAPVSGKATAVNVTLGGMASQSAPSVVIAENNELMVSVFASENIRNGVSAGDTADVVIDSISPEAMKCTVRSVAESANPQTSLSEITLCCG